MRAGRAISLAAMVATACAGPRPATGPVPDGTLLLGSADGVISLRADTGSVLFQTSGVPALGRWSPVFSSSPSADGTQLQATDPATGVALSQMILPGDLSPRVASSDGDLVALMEPLSQGTRPWDPVPRARTRLVVARPGQDSHRIYDLRGNFEPEAFAAYGETLFVIRHVPPTAPHSYRVARLDLSSGRVTDLSIDEKGPGREIVETMSGTRLEQVASPAGDMLYTLYTTAPDASAGGREHAAGFVHTLSLEEGWAHCVGLPRELWGGDPADQAMAVSADGDRLYVVDTARGVVAEMDTESLEMTRTAPVRLGSEGPARATIDARGNLVVASGRRVTVIDPDTLRATRSWRVNAPITALGSGPDGLYVVTQGRIQVIDAATGRAVHTAPSPMLPGLEYVGAVEA
jgi:hypothetical protein